MIPKTLHRIWIEGSPILPEEFAATGERWRELHPGWDFRTWTFPPFPLHNATYYDRAPAGDLFRYRADLLRLEILAAYGGVYADMDVVPLRPFDALLEPGGAFAGYSPDRWRGEKIVTNAIVGAEPGHPWILRCVERIKVSVATYGGSFTAMVVGPHHVNRNLRERDGVRIYDAPILYPRTKEEKETAFSYHMWANRNGVEAV